MNRILNGVSSRTVFSVALLGALVGAAPRPHPDAPSQVNVRLSEWKVELSQQTIATGAVRFAVTNAGSIPHGFAVEGRGIEKAIETIQPGQSDTLTLSLKLGTYEVYCPVGQDSHKKLGMETHLTVVSARGSGSPGYGASEVGMSHAPAVTVQAIRVRVVEVNGQLHALLAPLPEVPKRLLALWDMPPDVYEKVASGFPIPPTNTSEP